jgi:G3E family GTPase
MKRTRMLMVGGFLGAGKTTLLWEAARQLAERGLRVGLITNDQAPDLVDTAWLAQRGVAVQEVSGSCFCCNFPGLVSATENLRQAAEADVLIAEPVGSCTDLSATLLQPLKDQFATELVLSPLSVVVDPDRLRGVLSGETMLHADAAYILRKQMEEADVLLLNKIDRLDRLDCEALIHQARTELDGTEVHQISAQLGDGVSAWLDAMLSREDAGTKVVEIDYDRYANGEAVLGWLNATVQLHSAQPDWETYARHLLEALRDRLATAQAAVGHVKLLVSTGGDCCVANLTQSGGPVEVRGQVAALSDAELTLNARAQMPPADLESLVNQCLEDAATSGIRWELRALRCFSPGRPNPTHRYDHVV